MPYLNVVDNDLLIILFNKAYKIYEWKGQKRKD